MLGCARGCLSSHLPRMDVIHIPESTELVWHYTSAVGLKGIIDGHTLRATSADFMNDADEMRSGARAFAAHFEQRRNELTAKSQRIVEHSGALSTGAVSDSYLLSASRLGDSLTMWRNYGGDGVAYAIGLDRNSPLVPLEHVKGDAHPKPPPDFYTPEWEDLGDGERYNLNPSPDYVLVLGKSWHDVTYISGPDHEAVRAEFDHMASRLESDKGDRLLFFWMYPDGTLRLMKDAGFRDEREVRMVVSVHPEWKFVQHRPSRFGLVPYIELAASDNQQEFATERTVLPIREIMIGPSPVKSEAERALRMLLDNSGYGAVKIGTSEIPFR